MVSLETRDYVEVVLVKNISPTNFTGYRRKAVYNPVKARTPRARWKSTCSPFVILQLVREGESSRRNPVLDVKLDRIDRKGRALFADFDLAQRLSKTGLPMTRWLL